MLRPTGWEGTCWSGSCEMAWRAGFDGFLVSVGQAVLRQGHLCALWDLYPAFSGFRFIRSDRGPRTVCLPDTHLQLRATFQMTAGRRKLGFLLPVTWRVLGSGNNCDRDHR